MASKFDDRLSILNAAREAELAMEWFGKPNNDITLSLTASGYATNDGKAAQSYLHRAASEYREKIMATAKAMAADDVKRGEELL